MRTTPATNGSGAEPPAEAALLGAVAALLHRAVAPAVVLGLVEEEPAAAAHFGLIADVHALELAGEDFCRIGRQGNEEGEKVARLFLPVELIAGSARDQAAAGHRIRDPAVHQLQRLRRRPARAQRREDQVVERLADPPRALHRLFGALRMPGRLGEERLPAPGVDQPRLARPADQVAVGDEVFAGARRAQAADGVDEVQAGPAADVLIFVEVFAHRFVTFKMHLTGYLSQPSVTVKI